MISLELKIIIVQIIRFFSPHIASNSVNWILSYLAGQLPLGMYGQCNNLL